MLQIEKKNSWILFNISTNYTSLDVGVVDSTDVMYKLVNCWLNPNLLEAKQAYSPSSASVTDSKTRGLEYTFAGPSSIRPDFRTVKSWPFNSNVKLVGGLNNVLSTFLNHCEDIRKRKDEQLHLMTGTSFSRYHTIFYSWLECIMSNFVMQIQELQRD